MPNSDTIEMMFRKKILDERRVDGVVLFGDNTFTKFLPEIVSHKIPVVSFWDEAPKYGISAVLWDVQPGIEQLVSEAYRLGHKRAGCIFFERTADRKEIFISQCHSKGLAVPEAMCRAVSDESGATLATLEIAQMPDRPTLLFYSSDHLAVAGLNTLSYLGLRVPEDISVVGVDNAMYLPHTIVPLATIQGPRQERGRLAAKVLMETIKEAKPIQVFKLPGYFIPRQSLGAVS